MLTDVNNTFIVTSPHEFKSGINVVSIKEYSAQASSCSFGHRAVVLLIAFKCGLNYEAGTIREHGSFQT